MHMVCHDVPAGKKIRQPYPAVTHVAVAPVPSCSADSLAPPLATTPDDCSIHSAVDDILSATLNTVGPAPLGPAPSGHAPSGDAHSTIGSASPARYSAGSSGANRSLSAIAASIGKRKSSIESPSPHQTLVCK